MRVLLVILLFHSVIPRPHQSDEAEENSEMNEKDYEVDNTDREREVDNVRSSNEQQAEEQPYQLVDYSGNSFLQRAPAQPAHDATLAPPAADDSAAAYLSEDQNPDYEEDNNANLNEKYILGNKQRTDYRRPYCRSQISSNRASVDTYALDSDDQERETDEQESLTVQNNANNCRNMLHNHASNRADSRADSHADSNTDNQADKTKGKYTRYTSKQSVNRNNPALEYSPQSMYEGVLMSRQRGNRDNAVMNHNIRSMGIGNENEKPDVAEYKNSVPDQSSASAHDTEVIVKQNDDSFDSDNNNPVEYGEERTANIEGNRDKRNSNGVDSPKLMNEVADGSKPAITVQETNAKASSQSDDSSDAREQLAIRRHIANLTSNQLDELLASLSADKRELLQEIIGNDKVEVIKRDVTNNEELRQSENEKEEKCDESGKVVLRQASSDKYSGATEEREPDTILQDKQESVAINKKETVEISNKKDSEEDHESCNNEQQSAMALTSNKQVIESNDRSKLKNEVELDQIVEKEGISKASQTQKAESDKFNVKRETNKNDYDSTLYDSEVLAELKDAKESEESFVIPNDDEVTHGNDQSELTHDVQLSKRETLNIQSQKQDQSISEQLQALEDSFPSVRSYDETNYQGIKMSPLVRVKRNKRESAKRAAAVLPGNKPSQLSYRADTEDEDDDEGNEFEDDGFFDRTSNLNRGNIESCPSLQGSSAEKSNDANNSARENLDKLSDESDTETAENDFTNENKKNKMEKTETKDANDLPMSSENKQFDNPINQDLSNMGSDTDNVLSGSEGADENLMLTSAVRSRLSRDSDKDMNSLSESREIEDIKKAGEDLQSVQNDPNGAFGGLPKNYDGELSRYKRIRRTKQMVPTS